MKEIKIICNLDGIITSEELFILIAKYFNVQDPIIEELTKETILGNIPFIESIIRKITILGKLSVSKISSLLEEIELQQKLFEFIQTHSAQCVIVTENLECWCNKLIKKINCDFFCSESEVENDQVIRLIKILRKEQVVEHYQNNGYQTVFIGNGNSDLEAMRIADISIAAGIIQPPSKSVLQVSDYLIFNEETLCRQLSLLL